MIKTVIGSIIFETNDENIKVKLDNEINLDQKISKKSVNEFQTDLSNGGMLYGTDDLPDEIQFHSDSSDQDTRIQDIKEHDLSDHKQSPY